MATKNKISILSFSTFNNACIQNSLNTRAAVFLNSLFLRYEVQILKRLSNCPMKQARCIFVSYFPVSKDAKKSSHQPSEIKGHWQDWEFQVSLNVVLPLLFSRKTNNGRVPSPSRDEVSSAKSLLKSGFITTLYFEKFLHRDHVLSPSLCLHPSAGHR